MHSKFAVWFGSLDVRRACMCLIVGLSACTDTSSAIDNDTITPHTCAAPGICQQAGQYNQLSGLCVYPNKPDGTACDDNNVCSVSDTCQSGACVPSTYTWCPGLDACGLPTACDPTSGCPSAAATTCTAPTVRVPLVGCSSNNYWTNVSIGGNANYHLIIDSGSATLGVAAACSSCGVSPEYRLSSTGKDQGEATQATYGDNSGWSGEVISDLVTLPGSPATVRMNIAAISKQSRNPTFFESSNCVVDVDVPNTYQGILGLAQSDITTEYTDAFMDVLGASGEMSEVFAVQLCDQDGNFWVGGYDPNATTSNPNWTAMDVTSPYMAIDINDIQFGGSTLGYTSSDYGPAVVDTGTSLFVLPEDIYKALVSEINANLNFQNYFDSAFFGEDYSCYQVGATPEQLDAQLPPMSFVIPVTGSSTETFTLNMPATSSYLAHYQASNGQDYYCPGIEYADITIFGSALMHDFVVIFDAQAQQIGFAPQQGCTK